MAYRAWASGQSAGAIAFKFIDSQIRESAQPRCLGDTVLNDESLPLKEASVTILDYLLAAARSHSNAPALSIHGVHRTHGDILDGASAFAKRLTQLGVGPYDVVGLFAADSVSLVEAFYGILLAGAVPSILNPRWNQEHLSDILEGTPCMLLCADAQRLQIVQDISSIACARLSIEEELERARGDFRTGMNNSELSGASILQSDDPAVILYTTGSRGRPKAVLHSHHSLLAGAFQEMATIGCALASFVTTGGLFSASGLGFLIETLLSRGLHVIESQEDLERYFATIERLRPVAARLTGVMVDAPFAQHDLSSVRFWLQGGYRLREDQVQRFLEALGPRIVHGYGSTEAMGMAALMPADYVGRPDRWETLGRPVVGVRIHVERDNNSASDTPGRVWVAGSSVAVGYFGNPALTKRIFRGLSYDTGDIGFIDAEGYLHIIGRTSRDPSDDAAWPPQLELLLNFHPGVRETVVTYHEGELVALIETRPGATVRIEEVREFLAHRYLTDAQMPSRILMLSRLPRDERGKVLVGLALKQATAGRTNGL